VSGRTFQLGWLAAVAIGLAIPGVARAGCLHTNQLFSCEPPHGPPVQFYCLGSGVVLTCMDFSGGFILVAPHTVLSQISATAGDEVTTSADSQLSSQISTPSTRGTALAEALPSVGVTTNGHGYITGLAPSAGRATALTGPVIGVGSHGVTGVSSPNPSANLPRQPAARPVAAAAPAASSGQNSLTSASPPPASVVVPRPAQSGK
jgi:hypothetical protein